MKTYNTAVKLIMLILFITTGCDSFLEEVPKSNVTATNYYKTEGDAESAVVYAYQDLTESGIFGFCYWLIGDFASDNFTLTNAGEGSSDSGPFGLFTWDASTTRVKSFWSSHYNAIANANAGLEKIPEINGDATFLNQLMGELYFLRALYYFNLVRTFGDVPIILKLLTVTDDLLVSRDDAAEVYRQITDDLTLAIEKLPESPLDPGRASIYVAKTLLAKVYLTRASSSYGTSADYEQVISLCEDIEGHGGYGLVGNYLDLFKSTNELTTSESIFEVQFADAVSNLSSGLMNRWFLSTDFYTPTSYYQAQPSDDLASIIEPGDTRALLTVSDTTITGFKMTDGRWLTKYQDVETFGLDINEGANFYVLRYADVLLMLAEAENELNGPTTKAIRAVNAMRNRVGLTKLPSSSVSGKDVLRNAILKERRIEFVGEGQRWFDLVRTGRLVSTMQTLGFTNVDERHNRLAIPQAEIDENPNMTQNDGY
jgi:hypothetical protein